MILYLLPRIRIQLYSNLLFPLILLKQVILYLQELALDFIKIKKLKTIGKRALGTPIYSASFTCNPDENSFLAIRIFPFKSFEAFSNSFSSF